jgi:hypothetical protein
MTADKGREGPAARRSLWRVYATPICVGVVSLIGLVAALVGDGIYDIIGWLGLAAPAAAGLMPIVVRDGRQSR